MRSLILILRASSVFDNSTARRVPGGGVSAFATEVWAGAGCSAEFAGAGAAETWAHDIVARASITGARNNLCVAMVMHSRVRFTVSLLIMMRPAGTWCS